MCGNLPQPYLDWSAVDPPATSIQNLPARAHFGRQEQTGPGCPPENPRQRQPAWGRFRWGQGNGPGVLPPPPRPLDLLPLFSIEFWLRAGLRLHFLLPLMRAAGWWHCRRHIRKEKTQWAESQQASKSKYLKSNASFFFLKTEDIKQKQKN